MIIIEKINYCEIFSTPTMKKIENGVDFQILWSKSAIDDCWFNYKKTRIAANSLILLNPVDVLHLAPQNYKLYQITFGQVKSSTLFSLFLTAFCNQLNTQKNIFRVQDIEKINEIDNIIRRIKSSVFDNNSDKYIKSHNLFHLILKLICLKFLNHSDTVIELFKAKFSLEDKDTHFVKYHADYLSTTPKELLRTFVKKGYHKPSQVITNLIILEAQKKIINTSLSIKEIGFELGFDDPAYFSRFFKKHVGVSALDFKKNYNKMFSNTL